MQKSRCDAILLLSGGIDSTTVLEQLTKQGKKVFCLIFDYKQSLRKEIAVAASNAKRLKQPYKIVSIDLGFTGSKCSLISKSRISENRSFEQIDSATPTSYVEFRNGILLSYAVMFAEVNGINDIYGGFNGLASGQYPDDTYSFVKAFEKAANAG
ncbi:MAG: 7-cyano-7-deazaguanine synthase, partial [Exiguobacterium sp.]|nr:7-cyano-7-deazaguanine synthase [Exiguobacterium sp.]